MCLDSLGFPVMGVCSNMDWVMGEYVGLLGWEALLGHSKQYVITHNDIVYLFLQMNLISAKNISV